MHDHRAMAAPGGAGDRRRGTTRQWTGLLAVPALLVALSIIAVLLVVASSGWIAAVIALAAGAVTFALLAALAGIRPREVPPAPIQPRTSVVTVAVVVVVCGAVAVGAFVAFALAW